jgi:hypothetical protein
MANTKESLKFEGKFINEFNNNSDYRKLINNLLGTNYIRAEKSSFGSVSPSWARLSNKTGREVPKSDLYFVTPEGDKKGTSLKNGTGRATSSNYRETLALFETVYNNNFGKYPNGSQLRKDIDAFFGTWEPCGTVTSCRPRITEIKANKRQQEGWTRWLETNLPEDQRQVLKHIECASKLNPMAKSIRDNHPEFVLDVVAETLSGKLKFGNNSLSYAAHYIVCEKDEPGAVKIVTNTNLSSDAFRNECEKIRNGGSINVAMKSSGIKKWIRFM